MVLSYITLGNRCLFDDVTLIIPMSRNGMVEQMLANGTPTAQQKPMALVMARPAATCPASAIHILLRI